MAYQVMVYKVLIASPGDVVAERKAIPEVINSWNATHSEDYGVILMPVMCKRLSNHTQAIRHIQLLRSNIPRQQGLVVLQ